MKKNLKRLLSVVMAVVFVCSFMSVVSFAASGDDVLEYALTEFRTTAQVVSCDKDATGAVEVKDTVRIGGVNYKVTAIADDAFEDCVYITEITIPEGVTYIGSLAFKNCKSLKSIDIPRSLVNCSYDAFEGCSDVVVNCYMSNYQFSTVAEFSGNIVVNILDKVIEDQERPESKSILTLIREFFIKILSFFGIKIKK